MEDNLLRATKFFFGRGLIKLWKTRVVSTSQSDKKHGWWRRDLSALQNRVKGCGMMIAWRSSKGRTCDSWMGQCAQRPTGGDMGYARLGWPTLFCPILAAGMLKWL